MKEDAKEALERALNSEELEVEDVSGELVVGNRRGLDLVYLRSRSDAQDERISALSEKVAAQGETIVSLEDRVRSLTLSLDAYKLLRARFISTYKRDKLKIESPEDKGVITDGNNWAHGGDIVVDAQLYEGIRGRRDVMVFEKLYGLHPGDVHYISEFFGILRKC